MLPDWHTWGLLLNSHGDRENQELEETFVPRKVVFAGQVPNLWEEETQKSRNSGLETVQRQESLFTPCLVPKEQGTASARA